MNLLNILKNNKIKKNNSVDNLVELLSTNKDALKAFEDKYFTQYLSSQKPAKECNPTGLSDDSINELKADIVDNLVKNAIVYDSETNSHIDFSNTEYHEIDMAYFNSLPVEIRPMLTDTGALIECDDKPSIAVFDYYKSFLKNKDIDMLMRFKQGLSILDLDPVCYETLSLNPNNMGYWLPAIVSANDGIFEIPKTRVLKVPMTMLQLSRIQYETLNQSTKDIINNFCKQVFDLDENKTYFIKTGIFSYKFDFRNCKVSGSEVNDIGEYLTYITNFACDMSSPLKQPTIIGTALTNQWVVREYIEDNDEFGNFQNPSIYKGLPLRTEFRVFVDFDTQKVLSIANYWHRDVMIKRFEEIRDEHDIHDLITFKANIDRLEQRFVDNKQIVLTKVESLLKNDVKLSGQWSIDIMLSNDGFYLIDMALAEQSAHYETVPVEDRRVSTINWLPKID